MGGTYKKRTCFRLKKYLRKHRKNFQRHGQYSKTMQTVNKYIIYYVNRVNLKFLTGQFSCEYFLIIFLRQFYHIYIIYPLNADLTFKFKEYDK